MKFTRPYASDELLIDRKDITIQDETVTLPRVVYDALVSDCDYMQGYIEALLLVLEKLEEK